MSLDISIKIRRQSHCPHCGGVIGGDVEDEIMTGGHVYRELLKKIGYTDDDYGRYKVADRTQLETIARAFDEAGETVAAAKVALAALNGSVVEFEADW